MSSINLGELTAQRPFQDDRVPELLEMPDGLFEEIFSYLPERSRENLPINKEVRERTSGISRKIWLREIQKLTSLVSGEKLDNLKEDIEKIPSSQRHIEDCIQVLLFRFFSTLTDKEFGSLATFRSNLRPFFEIKDAAQKLREILSQISEEETAEEAPWSQIAKKIENLQLELIEAKGLTGFGLAVGCTAALTEKVKKRKGLILGGFLLVPCLPQVKPLWTYLKGYLMNEKKKSPVFFHRAIDQIDTLILDKKEKMYWLKWMANLFLQERQLYGVRHVLEKIPEGEMKWEIQLNLRKKS